MIKNWNINPKEGKCILYEPFPYEVFAYSAIGGWERQSKPTEKQLETEENGNEHRKRFILQWLKKKRQKEKMWTIWIKIKINPGINIYNISLKYENMHIMNKYTWYA